jgi:hypothetical protein
VDPTWSPDDQKIVFGADGRELWVVPATGGTSIALTAADPDLQANPNWSPNNAKIVYQREISFRPHNKIWTMDADGSNEAQLRPIQQDEVDPAWSPDGTKIVFFKPSGPGVSSPGVFVMNADGTGDTFLAAGNEPDWQPIPVNAYPRPKAASPLLVSLVTAYDQCTSSNRTHGPPLAFSSCNPPAKTSQYLTVGTGDSNAMPARNEGYLRLKTIVGNPSTPADEADVAISFFSDDVFTTALSDYTGELRAQVPLRITDKDNTPHPGGPGAATTQDFTFDVDASCTPVADPQEGSACQTNTTVDSLVPGAIKEGRRSIWQLGQVTVYDGGSDGVAATADNTVFARQGIFIP